MSTATTTTTTTTIDNTIDILLISGRSNEALARSIASHLHLELTPVILDTFSSGESRVEILQSVRKRSVYFVQCAYTYEPDSPSPNDYIMETVMVVDACYRAAAKEVVLVMPSLPYTEDTEPNSPVDFDAIICETDLQRYMKEVIFPSSIEAEKSQPDDPELLQRIKIQQSNLTDPTKRQFVTPFTHPNPFKLIAKLLQSSANGVSRLLTFSLPRAQLVGYFDIPVDDLPVTPLLKRSLPVEFDAVAVSDISRAKQVSQIANSLNLPFIMMQKFPNEQEFDLAGDENVTRDTLVVFIDEVTDRTFQAAQQLKQIHNCPVSLLIIHLFLDNPVSDIHKLKFDTTFHTIFATNSIKIPEMLRDKIKVIDVSSYLAESIKCTHEGRSLKSFINSYH